MSKNRGGQWEEAMQLLSRGVTQAEVARRLQVDARIVSRWYKDHQRSTTIQRLLQENEKLRSENKMLRSLIDNLERGEE
jgi:transposase-like protein